MQIQFAFLKNKVAKRIFLLFVVTSIIPIGIVGVISYNYVISLVTEQKQEQLAASSKAYGMSIYDRISVTENQFTSLGEDLLHSNNIDLSTNADTQIMLNDKMSTFGEIKIYLKPSNFDSSGLKHLLDGKTKITVSRNDNNLDIYFTRLLNTDEASRILSAKVNSQYIFGDMDIFAGDVDACVVIKNKGTLNCSNRALNTVSKSIFEKNTENESSIHTAQINNISYIYASWELFLNGRFNTDSWIIYYAQPSNIIFAPIKTFASIFLPALLLVILLVSLVSLNQISRILVPLEKLTSITKRIAQSDFSEKAEFNSNDEFQALGESFNYMTSELAKREEKLIYQANYDDLTGLSNRHLLIKQLKSAISDANHKKKHFAFLFVDLDRFKVINDSQGHATGDKLLIAAGERIKSCIRSSDTLARYGGDEFGVILSSINDASNASITAQEIIKRLSEVFYIDNYEQIIGASIGISVFPRDGNTWEDLLQKADIAMYKAKLKGRGRHLFFSNSMQEDIWEKAELEADLYHAIEREELNLVYQPQIDIESGDITGAETLLRWNHAKIGPIRPDRFITYAEDNGLIVALGGWAMREALKQCEKWQIEHHVMPKMAINISARQLRHENFMSDVEDLVSDFDIGTTNLEFEITESLFLGDDRHTLGILHRINQLGISIAIDDFGKGYSSLSYLKKLPAQTLKIDRLFIKDLSKDDDSITIVKAIIAMGKALNKIVVAEGVETLEQLNILKALGCDRAQGYYISKPKIASEFLDYSKTAIIQLDELRSNFKNVS